MDDALRASVPTNGAAEPGRPVQTREARPHLPLAVGVGTVLDDRYRLTGTLETDQVKVLYRAEEIETGRTVAVGVFQEIGRHDRGRIESFRRPGPRGASRLEIPSAFAAVYECGLTDDGRLFLVAELLEGPTVDELLKRAAPLEPARALVLAIRVGEALEEVLNLGVLDLRVAPQDIIIVPNEGDQVRLRGSDRLILRRLGLEVPLAAAEAPGQDPRYASPEELAGLSPTERSVVYRFGLLLYELLAGAPPFPGTTRGEVGDSQRRPLKSRLRARHQGLPASVDRLLSRMLESDPRARPGDLAWILNELWDAAGRFRRNTPARPVHADSAGTADPRVRPGPVPTRRWALAGLPILVMGGALLAWPYLVGGPTARIVAPVPTRQAVDVFPGPAGSASPLEALPSNSGSERGEVSPSTPPTGALHPTPSVAASGPPARAAGETPSRPIAAAPEPPVSAQSGVAQRGEVSRSTPPTAAFRPTPSVAASGPPAQAAGETPSRPIAAAPEPPVSAQSGVAQRGEVSRSTPPTAAFRPTPSAAASGPPAQAAGETPSRPIAAAPEPPVSAQSGVAQVSGTASNSGPASPAPETTLTLPPARPRQLAPENPRAADPSAIIDWLFRESPRISE